MNTQQTSKEIEGNWTLEGWDETGLTLVSTMFPTPITITKMGYRKWSLEGTIFRSVRKARAAAEALENQRVHDYWENGGQIGGAK